MKNQKDSKENYKRYGRDVVPNVSGPSAILLIPWFATWAHYFLIASMIVILGFCLIFPKVATVIKT
jgi:hypothetical protein